MLEDNLSNLVRAYPSAVVEYGDGTRTSISLEWYEQNSSSVTLCGYAIILLYKDGSKREIFFDSFEAMLEHLQNLLVRLEALKKRSSDR